LIFCYFTRIFAVFAHFFIMLAQIGNLNLHRITKTIACATNFDFKKLVETAQFWAKKFYLCAICTNRSQIPLFLSLYRHFLPQLSLFLLSITFTYIFFKIVFLGFHL